MIRVLAIGVLLGRFTSIEAEAPVIRVICVMRESIRIGVSGSGAT